MILLWKSSRDAEKQSKDFPKQKLLGLLRDMDQETTTTKIMSKSGPSQLHSFVPLIGLTDAISKKGEVLDLHFLWHPNKTWIKHVLNLGDTVFLHCLQDELFENYTPRQLNDLIPPRLLLIRYTNNERSLVLGYLSYSTCVLFLVLFLEFFGGFCFWLLGAFFVLFVCPFFAFFITVGCKFVLLVHS